MEMLQTVPYSGWPRGLYSVDESMVAPADSLLRADNVMIGVRGAIKTRPGILAYGNYMPDHINGIYCNSSMYLSTNDKKLIRQVATVVLKTYTNGGRGQFTKFKDKYCHSNGLDVMQVWTDVDATTSDAFGSPPLSRILEIHNDRVFAATGTTLYETAPGQAPDASVDYWATGASWAINAGSGKPIMAVKSLGRQGLFIFTRDEIWLQSGYTKQERQTRLFSKVTGCIAPDSLQVLKLVGHGDCIVFLGSNKKLYAVNLSGVMEIGDSVQAELDEIYEGNPADDTTPVNEVKHRVVSACHPDGFYLLGYARDNVATEVAWDRCLCLHTDRQTGEGGLWPFTMWRQTALTGEFPITFAAMAGVYDTARRSIMIGQKQVDAEYQPFMVRTDYEYDSDPYTVAGSKNYYIPWWLKTIDDNFGDDLTRKAFHQLVTHSSKTVAGDLSFWFSQTVDTDIAQIADQRFTVTPATADKVYRTTVALENTGTRISITLKTHPDRLVSYGYLLLGMEIRYFPAGLP